VTAIDGRITSDSARRIRLDIGERMLVIRRAARAVSTGARKQELRVNRKQATGNR
jgi:hypothetical protein